MQNTNIYIRMKNRINVSSSQTISIRQLARIIAEPAIRKKLSDIDVYKVQKEDNNFIVIDTMTVIAIIQSQLPDANIQTIGPSQTIVQVDVQKSKRPLIVFA